MNVLAVGPHPDDIELGCGAALLAHRRAGHQVTLLVMTDGENGPQEERSRRAEQEDAAALLGAAVIWGGFQDGAVPAEGAAVGVVEAALAATGADLVYLPAVADTHQDHRATASAALSATRRARRVLCYETPTTVNFMPTFYVDVAGLVELKLGLLRAHLSQVLKNGLVDLEAVEAQARYRGFQARMRQAEAFETSRFVWDLAAPAIDTPANSRASQEATK
jgi:LmbE family N-acetylglucosaminyl deacetylase